MMHEVAGVTLVPRLLTLSPMSAALGAWRSPRHGLARFVVGKVTFSLRAGESLMETTPQPLDISSELVPPKPRAEVIVTGSVFASDQRPTNRLVAYLGAGRVEKACEVRADRWIEVDGTLQEGPPFTQMALTWDRAAGGPNTINPAGRAPVRDAHGRMLLPNVQAVGIDPMPPDWTVVPTGFGPIAPHWPSRAALLGPHAEPSFVDGAIPTIPDELDFSFFQSAPRDQQVELIEPDTQLMLEHLHPSQRHFGTRLPGFAARAILEPSGAEVPLRCDTLWIDTDAQRATLTWRGMYWEREHPLVTRMLLTLVPLGSVVGIEGIRELVAAEEPATLIPAAARSAPQAIPFVPPPSSPEQPSTERAAETALQLLWFQADAAKLLRELPPRAREASHPGWLVLDGDAKGDDETVVSRHLAREPARDEAGLRACITRSVSKDGVLKPPVVAVEGRLALALDPFENLAVTLALAEPYAAAAPALKKALDAAEKLSKVHRAFPASELDAAIERVRKAFAAVESLPVGTDYLRVNAERWLVEERRYVTRTVGGEPCIPGTLTPTGGGAPIAVLVPTRCAPWLPLEPVFRAKLVGTVAPPSDGSRGVILRALVLAAVVGL